MRILIDLQACQTTGSRHRGIGRYSLELAKAMVKNAGGHEIHLMLSAHFPDAEHALRTQFEELLPRHRIHTWKSLSPVAELDINNQWRVRASELIREQAIAELRPDIVHISSMFEGLTDNGLSSIIQCNTPILTAVTLYDLIPLIHANPYLENQQVRSWYYRKVQALKRADLLLAISESSRQEGIDYLHLPSDRVVNISSAVDDRFVQRQYSEDVLISLRKRYHINKPFLMYTGGIDLRKNIEALIRAFASLPIATRQLYQLAIVCSIQELDRIRLTKLAKEIGLQKNDLVLTGFVPDEDLPMLYHACELFVFPSWHEGFGLPALEAMSSGAPTIAANTSSLPEVIGNQNALFDPYNEQDIADKISQVLNDKEFRKHLKQQGLEQAKKFSWDISAQRTIRALEEVYAKNTPLLRNQIALLPQAKKPKLAYFSPLPRARSGIADYSAELLPELAVYYDITLIIDQDIVEDDYLSANFTIRHWTWFDQKADQFDRILYNFGNSTFHTYMFDMIELHPGTIVLHDFFLSGIIYHLDAHGTKPGIWTRSLYESHGYQALLETRELENFEKTVYKYPCNLSILNKAEGVIVHSDFSEHLLRHWYGPSYSKSWKKIPHLRKLPLDVNKERARHKLGFGESDFILCSFGILGKPKLNRELLQAWLSSPLAHDSHCHLIFVGQNDANIYGKEISQMIANSDAGRRIKITGFADIELFRTYLAAADGAVQLRGLSRGETSGTVLDCMAYGIPTIVNSNGSMIELPEHALIKLQDEFTKDELIEKLIFLRTQKAACADLGIKAGKYIKKYHAPEEIGRQYFECVENYSQHEPQVKMHQTLKAIAALDVEVIPTSLDLQDVAKSLSSNREKTNGMQVLLHLPKEDQFKQVLKELLPRLIQLTPQFYRLEPVELIESKSEVTLIYTRQFVCDLLNLTSVYLEDEVVDYSNANLIAAFTSKSTSTSEPENFHKQAKINQYLTFDIDVLSDAINNEAFEKFSKDFWRSVINIDLS